MVEKDIDFIHLIVSREDVENNDFGITLASLNKLIENRETVLRFNGRVLISVEGYDLDSRELFEIDDVRVFFKNLDKIFPYWFYFISLDDTGSCIGFIARTLCVWNKIMPGLGSFEPRDLSKFLLQHFSALNELFQRFNLPEELNEIISDRVMIALGIKSKKDF